MLVLSAAYGVTVVKNPQVATALATGYVGLLLTVFFAVDYWRKP